MIVFIYFLSDKSIKQQDIHLFFNILPIIKYNVIQMYK